MAIEKRSISPLIFYIVVSTITSAIFVILTTLTLLLTDFFSETIVLFLAVFFLIRGLIGGFFSTIFSLKFSKEESLKGIGIYHARILSVIIGLAIGSTISDGIGAIVGAILFYFLGRWAGQRISIGIANQIERIFLIPGIPEDEIHLSPQEKRIYILEYIHLLLPLFFVFTAFALICFDIQVHVFSKYISLARFIFITLTFILLAAPWLFRYRMKIGAQTNKKLVINHQLLGSIFSVTPSIYGFILFIMGASIIELISFAGLSLFFAIIWLWYTRKDAIDSLPEHLS